jgi:hypothetical protein
MSRVARSVSRAVPCPGEPSDRCRAQMGRANGYPTRERRISQMGEACPLNDMEIPVVLLSGDLSTVAGAKSIPIVG